MSLIDYTELNAELAKLRERIDSADNHTANLAHDLSELAPEVFRNTARLDDLGGVPPVDPVPDPVTPAPNPVTPAPIPGTRRFGCNIGYKVDKSWSPDKPDHPNYAKIVAPFGCYRFMDWWKTNDDLNKGGGINDAQKAMLDRQINLCNENNADMYLCLLYHDSDTTIFYKVARCRDGLRHGLNLYVEWINEPWNLGTNVSKEIQWLSGVSSYGGGANLAFFDVWARYASNAFKIAKEAYPACVTVLGCLTANRWVAEKVEERLTTKPDAHGLTFYFGSGLGGTPSTTTSVDDILAGAADKIQDKELPRIRDHARWSKSIGRRIVGYEGGPHLTLDPNLHTSHNRVWQAMNQANRDPRIIPLIESVVRVAEAEGYERLFWFNLTTLYDQWGSWGLCESLDDTNTAKYRYGAGIN